MAEDILQQLEKLNFSINEAKVYLTLLRVGSSLAGAIAKEAHLDRSSTYNALKLLVERGIVSTIHETKRTLFIPANPKKILDYFKEKEEYASKIIPALQSLHELKKEKKNVLLFQGYKGVKTVFQDILDNLKRDEEYLIMSTEGQFGDKMPHYAPLFKKLKEKKGIRSRRIIREDRQKSNISKFSEYRTIPSEMPSPATINIYKDKVAIFIWDERPEVVLIENNAVSKTFKSYFEFIWKNAKPLRQQTENSNKIT